MQQQATGVPQATNEGENKSTTEEANVATDTTDEEASATGEQQPAPNSEAKRQEEAKESPSGEQDTIGIPVGVAVLHSLVEAGGLAPMLLMLQSEYPVMVSGPHSIGLYALPELSSQIYT